MSRLFILRTYVPDYSCEPSAGFFFILIFKKPCLYMFVFKFKNKNILHLLAGCVHHKISNMRVKLIKYGVQFFLSRRKVKPLNLLQ